MGIRVGIVGLGMMGLTHLDAYTKLAGVEVVALADRNVDRLSGQAQAAGNIAGQAQGRADRRCFRQYSDAAALIAAPDIDVVDICLPTPAHLPFGLMALEAGKHLLVEKPIARTYADAMKLVEAAQASGRIAMPAMCMRFWPGWPWLKEVVDRGVYGKLLGLTLRRAASHPQGPFYADGKANGGAALDLHLHDSDFVQFLFGMPIAVSSVGYSSVTEEVDHVHTRYTVAGGALVQAEGSWAMASGFPFRMQYTANFERATAVFDSSAEQNLMLFEAGDEKAVELDPSMGYVHEIAYFLDCIRDNRKPQTVTMRDAAEAIRLVEAEVESVRCGGLAVAL